jgi:hypothetical protein
LTLARSHASAPSYGSVLRDILTGVPSQDFINKGLISDAAPACFLAELIEHSRIDSVYEMRGPGTALRVTRIGAHGVVRRKFDRFLCQNCVRYPRKPQSNTVIYGDSDAHRCCGKSLMKCALVRVNVPY